MRIAVTALIGVLLTGCSSTIEYGASVTAFPGKIATRLDVSAEPKHQYARENPYGAIGYIVAHTLADMMGTPKHYVYTISMPRGITHTVAARSEFAVDACVAVLIPKERADLLPTEADRQYRWSLDEVGIDKSVNCQ